LALVFGFIFGFGFGFGVFESSALERKCCLSFCRPPILGQLSFSFSFTFTLGFVSLRSIANRLDF